MNTLKYRKSFVFCLILIISELPSHSAESCEINNSQKTYICKGITNVFPRIYYGNYNLRCEDCAITTFSRETFTYENSLISFNVSNSRIQYITPLAFSNLGNIQELYLQDNKIINISSRAFAGLRQVSQLILDNNLLVDLVPGFLQDLEANTVSLANNKIGELHDNAFEGALSLMSLNLQNNGMKTIYPDAFSELDSLEYLELQNNNLCSLPLGAFRDLRTLRSLNLANNKFTRFPLGTFSGLRDVYSLILANNSIELFEGTELLPLQRLAKLDISGNNIYYFDSHNVYSSAPSLRYLHLEDNTLSCPLLVNVLQYFKGKGVEIVTNVGRYKVQNINGIACTGEIVTEKIPFEFFLKKVQEDTRINGLVC